LFRTNFGKRALANFVLLRKSRRVSMRRRNRATGVPLRLNLGRNETQDFRAGVAAFTRVELLFADVAVALFLTLALPLLANGRLRSDRLVCANNLRRIGVAFH